MVVLQATNNYNDEEHWDYWLFMTTTIMAKTNATMMMMTTKGIKNKVH